MICLNVLNFKLSKDKFINFSSKHANLDGTITFKVVKSLRRTRHAVRDVQDATTRRDRKQYLKRITGFV